MINCERCSESIERKSSMHKYCKPCADTVKEENRGRYRSKLSTKISEANKSKEFREQFPDKRKAQWAVTNAIRDGKLVREPCLVCKKEFAEGHHEDYSKPLEVMWLCKSCHYWWHKLIPIMHKWIDKAPIEEIVGYIQADAFKEIHERDKKHYSNSLRKMLKGE